MFSKLHEECGVFGVHSTIDNFEAANLVYYGLYALQHRGQQSCGIAINDNGTITYHKDMGLVSEVFHSGKMAELSRGNMAIGHVRYSAAGSAQRENAQPLVTNFAGKTMTLVHNGSISNALELRAELEKSGAIFQSTSDTEVVAYLLARERAKCDSMRQAIINVMNVIEGAYCFLIMTSNSIFAVRDPNGLRPFCIGKLQNSTIFASESCALDSVGAEYVRDILPGEIISIDKESNMESTCVPKSEKLNICIFEYIYFARPDSKIDGVSVYKARIRAGMQLAKEYPVDADIVIGVPDSGTAAAIGYSEQSGITYGVGLIKNHYIGRTFIRPAQSERTDAVKIKLNALRETIAGKRVVMIDDSIVRGTTCRRIVNLLKNAGAKEVHLRISSPPFVSPCYFGTDVPSKEYLVACHNTVPEMAEKFGADSLGFLSVEGLEALTQNPDIDFCHGCFTGTYPVRPPIDTTATFDNMKVKEV